MSMYNVYPTIIKAHCVEDPLDVQAERLERLNHVCCVCQASLNGEPFNPELKTSHGYCETCLEVTLQSIGGHHENH